MGDLSGRHKMRVSEGDLGSGPRWGRKVHLVSLPIWADWVNVQESVIRGNSEGGRSPSKGVLSEHQIPPSP